MKFLIGMIVAIACIGAAPSLASAAGPADNFANATNVTVSAVTGGFSGSDGGNTTTFGAESGEQSHAGFAAMHSGWWKWTPTVSGKTIVTTCGSDYDTWLGVNTGNSLGSLAEIASNDDDPDTSANTTNHHCGDSNFHESSYLSFDAQLGVTYHIAVDGSATGFAQLHVEENTDRAVSAYVTTKNDGSGSVSSTPAGINNCTTKPAIDPNCTTTVHDGTQVTLTATPDSGNRFIGWTANCDSQTEFTCTATVHGEFNSFPEFEPIPPNDNIADATDLTPEGDVIQSGGSTLGASLESGEPSQQDSSAGSSVWYTWTAGDTSHLTTIDVCQSGANTLGTQRVAVIKSNDVTETPFAAGACRISFNSESNQQYYISVDAHSPGDEANFALYLNSVDPPANDNFADAQTLSGVNPTATGNNSGATHEAGETTHGGSGETASIWYKWTAPADETAVVDTCGGGGLDTSLGVYTGPDSGATAANLTEVGTNDNDGHNLTLCHQQSALQFSATQGVTYYLAVDSNYSATGDIRINVNFAPDTHQVTAVTAGAGSGQVTSSPDGIDCFSGSATSVCSGQFDDNSTVTLTATPDALSTFTGWSGACSGTSTCVLTVNSDQTATASFAAIPPTPKHSLHYSVAGAGTGTIASSPNLIGTGCTATACTKSLNEGAAVALTPQAGSGSVFTGWAGACTGTAACHVTMSADKSAVATFTKSSITPPPVTVTLKLGKAKLNRKKGTALLPATVSGPASISLSGKSVKSRKATAKSATTVKLPVTVTGKLRKKLKKSGKAKVSVKVTASNSADSSDTRTVRITLRQTKKKKKR